METRTEYVTETTIEPIYHRCPHCEIVYGIETDNGELIVAGLIIDFFKGKCGNCGEMLKWYSTDAQMQKIINSRKNRK